MSRTSPSLPDDFHLYATKEGNLRLRKRYSVGGVTIERWRRQLGVCWIKPASAKLRREVAKPILTRRPAKQISTERIRIQDDWDDFDMSELRGTIDLGSMGAEW